MRNWLIKNFCAAFAGLLIFLLGFAAGTIVDITFFTMYRKWDHTEKNRGKLIALSIVQIFIVIFIINATTPIKALSSSFSFGLMSSQVFLFVHAIETVSHQVFDRDCSHD